MEGDDRWEDDLSEEVLSLRFFSFSTWKLEYLLESHGACDIAGVVVAVVSRWE